MGDGCARTCMAPEIICTDVHRPSTSVQVRAGKCTYGHIWSHKIFFPPAVGRPALFFDKSARSAVLNRRKMNNQGTKKPRSVRPLLLCYLVVRIPVPIPH